LRKPFEGTAETPIMLMGELLFTVAMTDVIFEDPTSIPTTTLSLDIILKQLKNQAFIIYSRLWVYQNVSLFWQFWQHLF